MTTGGRGRDRRKWARIERKVRLLIYAAKVVGGLLVAVATLAAACSGGGHA
jgi:hypothetical protein